MERAQSKIIGALFFQIYVLGNHIHNIVSRSYFLNHIIRIKHVYPPNSCYRSQAIFVRFSPSGGRPMHLVRLGTGKKASL